MGYVATLVLLIIFGVLLIGLFYQAYLASRENFTSRPSVILIFTMMFVLISTVLRQSALINLKSLEANDILITELEGATKLHHYFPA